MNVATWGRYYWPVFLTVMGVGLLGPEIYAIATNVANTLSWWVWGELHVQTGQHVVQWNAARVITLGVWMTMWFWLTFHFWWGLFR